jgi:H+/gluconate symporter-like permease
VIAAAPGFKVLAKWIMDIPGSPLISLSVATSLMAAVTGSSVGSLGIIMDAFAKLYMSKGINPEAMHRIVAMASGPMSAMPHSGAVLTLLALTGLTHKVAYRHIFMTVVVGTTLSLVAALLLAIMI